MKCIQRGDPRWKCGMDEEAGLCSPAPAGSLLPCPFCGAIPQVFDGDYELLHRDGCFLEDVGSRWLIGDSQKLEAWNRRANKSSSLERAAAGRE